MAVSLTFARRARGAWLGRDGGRSRAPSQHCCSRCRRSRCGLKSLLAQQPTFKPEELEQFVAPIALYPDSLLAQVLMAPRIRSRSWKRRAGPRKPSVTGKALEEAMVGQKWDPSVKSLVAFPDVIAMMNKKLDSTQKLGDAFLAQQAEVMDAVQRLRAKAKSEGNLKSSKEQTVTTEPRRPMPRPRRRPSSRSSPRIPKWCTCRPTTRRSCTGLGRTRYPPYYYYPPYSAPGAAFFSFTVGVAVGSALWGNCNWGHGDVDINVNNYNNFNERTSTTTSIGETATERTLATPPPATERALAILPRATERPLATTGRQRLALATPPRAASGSATGVTAKACNSAIRRRSRMAGP